MLAGIKLLVIDEYSFLSIAVIDTLHRQLLKVFPHDTRPFGGVNIVLCGDPAQLAPVRAQPIYAYRGTSHHLAAHFHLFQSVVELDQPFRQVGDDDNQIHFRHLLRRVANSEASEDDWRWLQTRRPCCLSPCDNDAFDASKFIVSTNDLRKEINYDKLAFLSPVLRIDDCDDGVQNSTEDDLDGERLERDDCSLYAIGAEVMLTANLWTEAGLVNGTCGVVVDILKPADARKARVIMVDFPKYRGPPLFDLHPTVVPITQLRSGATKGVPLSLAWAITIHKAQGLTMDRVTIDLGRKEFASGLTFVALSRAKTFDGLRIHAFDLQRFKRIEKGTHVEERREEFRRLRALAAATVA
jgi:ATP-dependent DNA helicase PIF1